jgi:hypothetical protein
MLAFILALFTAVASKAAAQDYAGPQHPSPIMPDRLAYYSFYASFVPTECCFTSTCCWEIGEDEVEDLGNNRYRIVATGQVVVRRGYSPDGAFHRCACDPVVGQTINAFPQRWLIHVQANTRCLFTPSNGS